MVTVFVSYIRRYVLTTACLVYIVVFVGVFSSPIFGDMFLLELNFKMKIGKIVFSSPIFGDMFLLLFDQLVDISTIIDIFNGTLNGQ